MMRAGALHPIPPPTPLPCPILLPTHSCYTRRNAASQCHYYTSDKYQTGAYFSSVLDCANGGLANEWG